MRATALQQPLCEVRSSSIVEPQQRLSVEVLPIDQSTACQFMTAAVQDAQRSHTDLAQLHPGFEGKYGASEQRRVNLPPNGMQGTPRIQCHDLHRVPEAIRQHPKDLRVSATGDTDAADHASDLRQLFQLTRHPFRDLPQLLPSLCRSHTRWRPLEQSNTEPLFKPK